MMMKSDNWRKYWLKLPRPSYLAGYQLSCTRRVFSTGSKYVDRSRSSYQCVWSFQRWRSQAHTSAIKLNYGVRLLVGIEVRMLRVMEDFHWRPIHRKWHIVYFARTVERIQRHDDAYMVDSVPIWCESASDYSQRSYRTRQMGICFVSLQRLILYRRMETVVMMMVSGWYLICFQYSLTKKVEVLQRGHVGRTSVASPHSRNGYAYWALRGSKWCFQSGSTSAIAPIILGAGQAIAVHGVLDLWAVVTCAGIGALKKSTWQTSLNVV